MAKGEEPRKEVSKSIRITAETEATISSFEGKNFNDKLENLIVFYTKKESVYREKIRTYEEQLAEIRLKVAEKKAVLNRLREIEPLLERVLSIAEKL